jgi:phage tail-like protein
MISQPRALVRMPEVVGIPLRKARLLIEHVGLVVDSVVFQESYERRDTVLMQKPARGQMVYGGEKVTLVVSRESYVKWLPSIYQRNDINGRNFYRDFLWIIQHLFGSIEEILDVIHAYFDPYEAPEKFLPWLASWSAMIIEEDWPIEKKRRLIRKAIELYRIRGTVKGLKLFIALFTGHEPEIKENVWPFRGWRIGVTSEIAVDTVVLPPVNLAHTFIVEMPVSYKDVSPEAVIRIHEIIQMEKPANTQYYLRFAAEERSGELNEFMAIGVGGTGAAVGIGAEEGEAITSEEELQRVLEAAKHAPESLAGERKPAPAQLDADDGFQPLSRTRPPLPKAPRADNAPVEGREAPRSSQAGGFDKAARGMQAISETQMMEAMGAPTPASTKVPDAPKAPEKIDAPKAQEKIDAPKAPEKIDAPKTPESAEAPKKIETASAANKTVLAPATAPVDKPAASDKPATTKTVVGTAAAPKEKPPAATSDKPAEPDPKKTRIGTPPSGTDEDPEKK